MPTNYEKYFGTPERAARIVTHPKELSRMLQDMAEGSDAAIGMALAWQMIDEQVKEQALRSWLESEADHA